MGEDSKLESQTDVCLARQPILDQDMGLVAYELLYRPGPSATSSPLAGEQASSVVLANALLEIGLGVVCANKTVFVNCSQGFLEKESHLLLPPERTVLEVLETVEPTPRIQEVLKAAARRGYQIALDDFAAGLAITALLPMVDIVKIDFLELTTDRIEALVDELRPRGLKLVAERVETPQHFVAARKPAFGLFQGYFFAKPKMVTGKGVPSVHINMLDLLVELSRSDTNFDSLQRLVSNDVALTTRLLRYINSARFRWSNKVSSVRTALTLVGINELRKWVRIILLGRLTADEPAELLVMSLVRARFCELVAERLGSDPHIGFTVGLLSLLDAILKRPMAEIIEGFSLSDEVCEALLNDKPTGIGSALTIIAAIEAGDWEDALQKATQERLAADDLSPWYVESTRYASAFYELAQ